MLAACGGAPARQDAAGAPAPGPAATVTATAADGALNPFAGQPVIVVPVQSLSAADAMGWRAKAGEEKALLVRADSAIEAQFGARGLAQWVFPTALVRSSRRNPTYITDPYQLRAVGPVRTAMRSREAMIVEPLSSQLRGLAGIGNSRWALVPLELAFVADAAGGGRARLSLVMIDVRAAQLRWSGAVLGDASPDYTFAAVASAIQRAADLVVPR